MKTFTVVTLFPEMVSQSLSVGVVGRAFAHGLCRLNTVDLRKFAEDAYGTVDDRPYGGGPGMVLMAEPCFQGIAHAKSLCAQKAKVVYLSPQGQRFDQAVARRWAQEDEHLIFLAGRYEGVDERLLETCIDEEWSLGDYVLSGGELAAAIMIDATTRLLSGVLGDASSALQDSFEHSGLLDYPHFTRPESWRGQDVPDILKSGHHAQIQAWRQQQAQERTAQRRPDLWQAYQALVSAKK